MTHALAVVWPHYPTINLQAIGGGFARGTGATRQEEVKDEVEDAAKKLDRDAGLFGETDGDSQT